VDLGISGKTALVLGGGGGLGGAIAQALAAEGAAVAVADISPQAAEGTVEAVADAGGKAVPLEWDLADLDAIDQHIAAVEGGSVPWTSWSTTREGRRPRRLRGRTLNSG
jgi:3-oxoacyl-[acyl-carrier protein] reductase